MYFRSKVTTLIGGVLVLFTISACGATTTQPDRDTVPITRQAPVDGESNNQSTPTNDQNSSQRGDQETTVTYEGFVFTCGEATNAASGVCSQAVQTMFDRYKGNLDRYANSGLLGALNDRFYDFTDVSYVGLYACVDATNGVPFETFAEQIIDPSLTQGTYDGLVVEDIRPAWITAQDVLCPS